MREVWGRRTEDPWAWLADDKDPATIAHLHRENAWTDHATSSQGPLREEIFEEIRARTEETDMSVPVRDGSWWYHVRTTEGLAYPIHCRRPDDPATHQPEGDDESEQVILDQNLLAEGHSHLSIGVLDVSPDGNWLACGVDTDGDELFELTFLDLRPLAEGRAAEASGEVIEGVGYGFAWAADSATCWYTLHDDAHRPDRVVRHRVGTDPADDLEVFRESDERFHVGVGLSRSGTLAVIESASAVTSESWLLDAHDPVKAPSVVTAREQGVEYSVAHRGDGLYVLSNHGGARDFALWCAPLVGTEVAPPDEWREVVAHQPGRRLDGVEAFARHLVVHGRADAATVMWLLDPQTDELSPITVDESVSTSGPSANPTFDTDRYRFTYQSLTTPPTLYELDVTTGDRTILKRQTVLGDFDPDDYESTRGWAQAADGTRVPISLVWRRDRRRPGQPMPCLLYGYGAYEASMDPWFSVARLSLLDRGVVFAIAHVRGGGEMGREWYEDGKFGAKHNSFDDFVACARHLIAGGWTTPDRLAARGGSAGGLLMGAATNLAPELWRAVVAEVGFVDPLNTMLDPSLPLTVIEREEWGDPLNDEEAYSWLASYSPYENVEPADEVTYPAVLATAGLNDPRVGFHEPTKWVARLREQGHGVGPDAERRPVLLRVEMDTGHGGPSGRYDAWREEAFILAWTLGQILPCRDRQPSP